MNIKKGYWLLAGVFSLSILLAACGDVTPTPAAPAGTTLAAGTGNTNASGVPNAAGASVVTLPDGLKQAAQPLAGSVPNGSFAAYKLSDEPAKAKTSLADSFKTAGWDDQSGKIPAQATAALEQQGMFFLLFQKGGKMAQVIGYPGSMAAPLGANVTSSDTFYIVVSGGN